MRIKPGTPLHVALEFAPDRIVPVGRLALDRGIAVLEYAPGFPASPLRINPLFGAPGAELVRAKEPRTFGGLHGALADSLPDAWGIELMRRRAAASGIDYGSLTVLDKLAIVGRRGMERSRTGRRSARATTRRSIWTCSHTKRWRSSKAATATSSMNWSGSAGRPAAHGRKFSSR